MDDAMLDAHVQFEVSLLTGDGLTETIGEEVTAFFAWLDEVSLSQIADPDAVAGVIVDVAGSITGEEVADHLHAGGLALRSSLEQAPETVGDVLSREQAVEWATSLAAMDDARAEILDAVTTSTGYSRLVAHVVYQGIKSYLLTENALAKRIPGASSLVRLGQRGLSAAAPGLEANVDRQLIAFVDANIADTIRDSRRFIDSMLDVDLVETMANDAWDAAEDRSVGRAVDLLTEAETNTLVDLVWQQWCSLRDSDLFARTVEDLVQSVFADHGERAVADLLAGLGVTADVVTAWLVPVAAPLADAAYEAGFLEERIRARLSAFYDQYEA